MLANILQELVELLGNLKEILYYSVLVEVEGNLSQNLLLLL
jgi:hypothetical protein